MPGSVHRLKVITANSPSHVVGRLVLQEAHYHRLMDDLIRHCELGSTMTRHEVGMGVVA